MPLVTEFKHLGLTWAEGRLKPKLDDHITSARRTSYRLMGAGLHGGDGLDPAACNKLIDLYVSPRLLLGLEASVLNRTDIAKLESYYRRLLRMIQSLPESTANSAVYLLTGNIPLEGRWHQRVLSLFGSIARLGEHHPLYRLAARQLTFSKDERPYSWFTQLETIASKYDINIHEVLARPWSKEMWKYRIKHDIRDYWKIYLMKESQSRSTLKWMIMDPSDGPHGVWKSCTASPYLARAAATRAKALCGRLCILEHSWRKSNLCPVCEKQDETVTHFLLECQELSKHRNDLYKLYHFYEEEGLQPPNTPYEITSAIINGDRYCSSLGSSVVKLKLWCRDAHNLCSMFCHRLIKERDYIINARLMMDE